MRIVITSFNSNPITSLLLFTAVLVTPSWCAEPLRNTGVPITVPVHCTDDDIAQAGLTCSDDSPCPVYLDLTAVANVGAKLFLTGNLHAETATLYSVLLESDDNAATWTEPVARIRNASLDLIQFPDFEHGWASGEMLQPLPHDPFFLTTTDGAKTWRQRPIFDDGKPGSVLSFWFGDATRGFLVLDKGSGSSRYELYESPTGGDTWSIRESGAKPLKIKSMPPAGASGWRIRADGKTQTLHLEQASGETWKSLASFLIKAGACKPGEAPEKP